MPAPPHPHRLQPLLAFPPSGYQAVSKPGLPAVSGEVNSSTGADRLFCERCGTGAPLNGPAGASFCMGCRLYLCARCAPAGAQRCGACRQGGSHASQGIRAACDALEALREVERDLLAMAEAYERGLADGEPASTENGSPGGAQRLEDLELKQRAAEAAVDHALRAPRRRDSRRASEIRTEMFGVLASIELAAAKVRKRTDGGGATWTGLSRLGPRRRLSRNALVAVALWTVAGAVGVAALSLWLGGRSLPAQFGMAPTSAPLVGVAAPPARGAVAGATPVAEPGEAWSFDELRIGSSPPDGIVLRAGDGAFAVVALPNAIDRSLRLRATEAPGAVCHRLSGVPTRLAVRVLLEGTLLGGSQLVDVISADGSRLIGAVLTDAGILELQGARQAVAIGRLNAGQWFDLRLRLNPSDGRASLMLHDEGGMELGRAAVQLEYPISSQEVCFGLPAGEPAAELYIDELRITY